MWLQQLSGREFNLDIRPSQHPMKSEGACRSKIQFQVGQRLKELYPRDVILEEVYLPDGFYLDFFIPSRRIAIEVQGRQHDEFVPHFHGSKADFFKSKVRDNNKAKWCQINEIELKAITAVDEL